MYNNTITTSQVPHTVLLDRNRARKIVFYGRVSTEHEAQLAALENQMQWYDEQAQYHPNWTVLGRYIDRGITGTQAKKRPAFMRMIEDAKAGAFDLIVTREVCRFARNTVDTLVATRQLKSMGVEVYFVEDNIWTMDGDGELRLTIMATLAQEESRKISERVRAGQKISRDNGVLYGTGNILGYNRVNGTYIIDPEQAETVRMIYDLYMEGLGETKICKELCRRQRRDSHGSISWTPSKISRILRNATYMGYKCYFKSFSNNYLEQKRIKNLDENSYLYVKGDFEPIIPEDLFRRCEEIRHSRTTTINGRRIGQHTSQDVWLHKLLCSCGSHFRKNKWRTNERGDSVYGYQCYNQSNNGSRAFRERNGLDTDGYCGMKMIADWKLELMAKEVFQKLWANKHAVLEACRRFNTHLASVQKALDESIDLHGGQVDPSLIEKYVSCVVPVDNTHFCWHMDLASGDKQSTIVTDKNGEDAEHPHRAWDNASAFLPDGKNAYQFLIAACAAARRAMGTRKGEQDT